MATRSIAREEWMDFFKTITADNMSRLVTVRVSDPAMGYQTDLRLMPFVGIDFDPRSGEGGTVQIMVGRTDSRLTTHTVLHPASLFVLEDQEGRPEVLEIETGDGGKTMLMLRPEEVGESGTLAEAQERGR